jgi:S-formylglutathione hydrolase FrmB
MKRAMMNFSRSVIIALFFFSSSAFSQVTVIEDSIFSASISGYCQLTILLPNGYHRSNERYQTIYLLHGFNGDNNTWFNSSRLIQLASQYHCIMVSPNGQNSWYTNSVTQPSLRYEDLFIRDVIAYIDSAYRTKKSGTERSIVGFSMGGFGALKFGFTYPEKFRFVGAISPSIQFPLGLEDSAIVARRSAASNASVRAAFGATRNDVWPANDIFHLLEQADAKKVPYIYLSVGSNDVIPEVIDQTHLLAERLRKKKIRFEMHESEGGHDWKFWDSEIEIVLQRIAALKK